jgi:Na+-exporting ATPase
MSPKKSDDSEIHVSGQANKPLSLPPHALTSEQFIEELNVHVDNGLTSAEAGTRLEEYGANSLDEGPGVQPVKILIKQIANAMILASIPRIYFCLVDN